jgi:VanZ family protein
VLCGFPGNQIPNFEFLNQISFDKIIHMFIFAVQSYLLFHAFTFEFAKSNYGMLILDIALFGLLIEFLQSYVFVNRYGEWVDVLANTLGAALGALSFFKLKPIKLK